VGSDFEDLAGLQEEFTDEEWYEMMDAPDANLASGQ
jgi:hypothetical protein